MGKKGSLHWAAKSAITNSITCSLNYGINQGSDAVDRDANDVTGREGEVVGGTMPVPVKR
jgi:hypothetical protein